MQKLTLWHCHNARSLRPLWALEELGLNYELIALPFPPRVYQKDFLSINPLGTVPFFKDGDVTMTESTAICQYLEDVYGAGKLGVSVDHEDYGKYLNFMHHSDATLTFPQAIYLRYSKLEPDDRKQPQVANDYKRWFLHRLSMVDQHLESNQFLCADRFTMADIAIAYALYLGLRIGLNMEYQPQTQDYLDRLMSRSAFKRAIAKTESDNNQFQNVL